MTALGRIIAARIAAEGPMRLDDYMRLCLLHPDHGYYATRDPFGAGGDFTTAPEISQMFSEMVGLALAQAWLDQGAPAPFTLAELGPGRGTLMADILRATRKVPGFADAARVVLVEASAHLRGVQRDRLGAVAHCDDAGALPDDRPLFLVANEFFDALPIRQFQRVRCGWAERMVTLAGDRLAMALAPPVALDRQASDGEVWETCAEALPVMAAVAGRIARHGGAAIVIDYGTWDGRGDSFQALRGHAPTDPLAQPGLADLTAHVDFAPLAAAALAAGAAASAPVPQGDWLLGLGIAQRASRLAAAGDAGAAGALDRLTSPVRMGQLFKAMAVWPRPAPPPPGFLALTRPAPAPCRPPET
ncbi:class I SAM-dependent methyltransferase [Paracoccus luteus]|uniref:class I SAM-dependent methyltransferase n=1 Tax=Paracoccus luteus TaxID=2508543 RepID=UPI00106F3BD4|nr:SAM-dependent methyltransferase [Paracoccus luteus]